MGNLIDRPSFYEGQILGGDDLNAGIDHARGQLARHERYLHLWGIAEGLELQGEDKKTSAGEKYQEITLKAGVALDSSGREIVVPQDARLPSEQFDQSNRSVGQTPGAEVWYPVFLTGRDTVAPAAALAVGQCGNAEADRWQETFQFDFGRPGDETGTDDAPAIAEGPGSGLSSPRHVLLGFVKWDTTLAKFVEVKPKHEGIGRRYAGVRADVVAARGGGLAVRTRTAAEKGKPGLALSEDGDGLLAFGPLTSSGAVEPVFSVNAKGDLTIAGKFTGAVTPGSMQLQSGMAMDGVILPLPPGITQEMVDDGKALVHVQVSPHVPGSPPPDTTATWGAFPLECRIDADRRVRCMLRWYELAAPNDIWDLPASCDYTVIVSVPAA